MEGERITVNLEYMHDEWFLVVTTQPNGYLLFMHPFFHLLEDCADENLENATSNHQFVALRDLARGMKEASLDLTQRVSEHIVSWNDYSDEEEWSH